MMAYQQPAEIEIEWRKAGKGICIIVEGETAQDDAWYFGEWFNNRAQDFTFIPQNGWQKVLDAVAFLRPRLGEKKVYGIRDRDFETNISLEPFPANGIACTPKYTLENYLLDPEAWHKVAGQFLRRNPVTGWMTVAELTETIRGNYRACLSLSAFNWCLRLARQENNAAFTALTEAEKSYREHPQALQNIDVPVYLGELGRKTGLPLDERYEERLTWLNASDYAIWEQVVSGKYVLKLLKERFPIALGARQAWVGVLDAYMQHCTTPPVDLLNVLEFIYRDSQIP
jgi:hypothetical protein